MHWVDKHSLGWIQYVWRVHGRIQIRLQRPWVLLCFPDVKALRILYCIYVRSHLECTLQIWNPRYQTYVDRSENIKKHYIKYLCYHHSKIPYCFENYLKLCSKFHIMPLSNCRNSWLHNYFKAPSTWHRLTRASIQNFIQHIIEIDSF